MPQKAQAVKSSGEGERLQKVIASFGVCSRRAAEELIAQGRVSVNGKPVTEQGFKVRAGKDKIAIDGELLSRKPDYVYILLNKPTGCICTAADEKGRRTVLDLLDSVEERVFPVGRLDYATSGMLLLTNDGELTNLLLHPKNQIDKTYLAFVEGHVAAESIRRLREGVRLEDGMTAPARVRVSGFRDGMTALEITIHEGRNRQVRRMLEAVGCPCLRLRRLSFAGLADSSLKPGEYRALREDELAALRKLTGLSK